MMTQSTSDVYAFMLGLVAAVNPCGFPLLPAYLALFAGGEGRPGWTARTIRGITAGACVTLGFVAVFGVLGLLVEAGVQLITAWVPWVMIGFGFALAVLGTHALAGGHWRVPLPAIPFRPGRSALAMIGFGVAYAVASLSCALPLFLAGVAGTFIRHDTVSSVRVFLAYALGMGVLVIAASLIAAHLGGTLLRRVAPATRFIPRVAGAVVGLVGVYLVYYWVSDVLNPLATPVIIGLVDAAQSVISAWLARFAVLIGSVLGAIVLASVIVLAVAARSRNKNGSDTHHA